MLQHLSFRVTTYPICSVVPGSLPSRILVFPFCCLHNVMEGKTVLLGKLHPGCIVERARGEGAWLLSQWPRQ